MRFEKIGIKKGQAVAQPFGDIYFHLEECE